MRKIVLILSFIISSMCLLYYVILDTNNRLQKYVNVDRRNFILYVDSDFTNEERNIIQECVDDWMDVVDNVYIDIKIKKINWKEMLYFGSDEQPTIYKTSNIGFKRDVGRMVAGTYDAIGLTTIRSGDVFIFIDDHYFKQVVKHEIGHILIGFAWHSSNKRSLMYPISNLNTEIMEEEINLIRENVYVSILN